MRTVRSRVLPPAAVRDRDERGVQGLELAQRDPQRALALVGLGREELEREGAQARSRAGRAATPLPRAAAMPDPTTPAEGNGGTASRPPPGRAGRGVRRRSRCRAPGGGLRLDACPTTVRRWTPRTSGPACRRRSTTSWAAATGPRGGQRGPRGAVRRPRRPAGRGQAAAPGVLLLGLARCRRDRPRGGGGRRDVAGAAAGVRAHPRRRHGRLGHPPRPAERRTGGSRRSTAAATWLGSHEAFGVGAAILLGDLCLSWADELLHVLRPARRRR